MIYKVGDRVLCLCGGKVSRLEGTVGKWMPGTVDEVMGDELCVKLDHRMVDTAPSFSRGMRGLFNPEFVKPLEKGRKY